MEWEDNILYFTLPMNHAHLSERIHVERSDSPSQGQWQGCHFDCARAYQVHSKCQHQRQGMLSYTMHNNFIYVCVTSFAILMYTASCMNMHVLSVQCMCTTALCIHDFRCTIFKTNASASCMPIVATLNYTYRWYRDRNGDFWDTSGHFCLMWVRLKRQ